MLDVKRLRVLREVAERGSFSAAAEALAYTQSAVSQQIAALEREAGTRLVDRSARGVTLTQAGAALVAHAEAILSRLADAEAELDAIAGLRGGRLRMTTFSTAGATIVPPAIVEFRRRHPGVELTLSPAEPNEVGDVLRGGHADLSLMIASPNADGTSKHDLTDLAIVDLLEDPMFLMLPADHELADRETVAIEELSKEDWILGSSTRCPDGMLLTQTCRDAGFEPRIAFYSDDYLAVQGFVAGGFGITFIPDMALVAVRDDVVVLPLAATPPRRRIQVATLEGSWDSPARQAMLDILVEESNRFTSSRAGLTVASWPVNPDVPAGSAS